MPEDPRADSPCPELAELILASEGELPKRRQREVWAHARYCPACRDTLGHADTALKEFQDALETPQLRAAEAATAADRTSEFRVRLRQEQRTKVTRDIGLPGRSWLPIAAAVPLLIAALFFSNRYSIVVRAEELLTRAAAHEESAPMDTVRRLEIRVRRSASGLNGVTPQRLSGSHGAFWSLTREVIGSTTGRVTPAADSDSDELAMLFTANHFNWHDPLSVRALREWRDSLAHKTDTITLPDADTFALRTTTPDGVLRSAVLIVRRVDFQPIQQTLTFEGFGEVEIVELSRWIRSAPTVAEYTPSAPSTSAPSTDSLDETELDVRKALHDLSIDWNPAITIARSAQAVEVRGRIDAQSKTKIANALSKLASVKVLIRAASDQSSAAAVAHDASAATPSTSVPSTSESTVSTWTEIGRSASAPITSAPSAQPLQRWLERTFGRGERSAPFLPALTADSEEVERRSAAFAALAQRFPESETRRLSGSARKKLDALADAQYLQLVKAVEALDDRLALFLGTPTRSAAAEATRRPWQDCATAVSARVERLNRAIQDVLRERDLPLPTEIGPGHDEPPPLSNLRQASDALWEQLHSAGSE